MRMSVKIGAFLGFLFFCQAGMAKLDTEFGTGGRIVAKDLIAIKKYNAESDSYTIYSVKFWGEGFSEVTAKSLQRSISNFNFELVVRKPSEIVGNQFNLDQRDLTILSEEEIAKRKEKVKSSKKSMILK